MKQEELEPYLQSLRDWLLDNKFEKDLYCAYFENYIRKITSNRDLIICIDFNNQYIYVEDKKEDILVTIYNSDINGKLSIEYLELLLKLIYWKNENNK
jgi:hypothetical protein